MTILTDLIEWCDEERRTLRTHLQLLEDGTMRTGRVEVGGRHVDTTAETVVRTKKNIAELDDLLVRHRR